MLMVTAIATSLTFAIFAMNVLSGILFLIYS
jgi:hypothetical protein